MYCNHHIVPKQPIVPAELRNVGLKCSFVNAEGVVETWEFGGGMFTSVGRWTQQVRRAELSGLEQEDLLLEEANNINAKFISDWGWQKGNRDYTTGAFKEGSYFVSNIIDVKGESFDFQTNANADLVCCYSTNNGVSFRNSQWVNKYSITGYTHIFIILSDSKDHYTGPSTINVYTFTQKKYFKNATKEELNQDIKELSDKVSLFDGRIEDLEADAYGGNKVVSISFSFNPCLFAIDGKDITSDAYPNAYATDYLDLDEYDHLMVNGACILSFPNGVFYDADKKIIKAISPGGQSVVKQYPELVLSRSEYPDGARYVRFHSYSTVDGVPIVYSCIGNKIIEGYDSRFVKLENSFGSITTCSTFKEIH